MEIKPLQKKDYKKVIQFAITGMNFKKYITNTFLLNAYGKYFWYLELINATQIIASYNGDDLFGILVVDMKNETKPYYTLY